MAVEYTDNISAEGYPSHHGCRGYDTKSDGEASVWENVEYLFIAITFNSTLAMSDSNPVRILSMDQTELFNIKTECKQMT